MVSRSGIRHQRPAFGITETVIGGRAVAIREEAVISDPFCTLLHFAKDSKTVQPRVLVVAPLSGHFATLLRGTIETLLIDHDVYVTDWINARNVPLVHGRFDLDDFIDVVIKFLHVLGTRTHVVARCGDNWPAAEQINAK